VPQFFVPPNNFRDNTLHFDPSESRHLIKALRKKEGDVVQIFDGMGFVSHVKLTDLSDSGRQA